MSLTVKHLNADTTFLITLRPDDGDLICWASKQSPAFTILIDPWLSGRTVIGHRYFSSAEHSVESCINHLSQLDQEPDLVIISQAKPDHCHEPTLRQIPSNSPRTTIVAEPRAANAIRKFNHFHPTKILSIPKYNSERPQSVLRFRIEPLTESGAAGEVAVALLPARDMAGVHNAIGITYQAPTAGLPSGSTGSPSTPLSKASITPEPTGPAPVPTARSETQHPPSLAREGVMSILYSPHGIPSNALLDEYASKHLHVDTKISNSRTLTLLIHSFTSVQSPWYLGGNIIAGASRGGIALAKKLRAECWIGAHDEEKINGGVIMKFLKRERETVADIMRLMRNGAVACDVRDLEVGGEVVLRA
ncbi:hypothetical protein ACJ73_08458 [Blastomyces percursus]|uniref:Metallo-beta-lactamase domain-containing protein n=1 Tax=Blastomyces percursus TaxID=1658174 RepID=A0A1J9PUZ7_9EURO|nr:hypothetical protein ACJ73_08458 [Blastomyces percursus]